jgi:hypothetical protein
MDQQLRPLIEQVRLQSKRHATTVSVAMLQYAVHDFDKLVRRWRNGDLSFPVGQKPSPEPPSDKEETDDAHPSH